MPHRRSAATPTGSQRRRRLSGDASVLAPGSRGARPRRRRRLDLGPRRVAFQRHLRRLEARRARPRRVAAPGAARFRRALRTGRAGRVRDRDLGKIHAREIHRVRRPRTARGATLRSGDADRQQRDDPNRQARAASRPLRPGHRPRVDRAPSARNVRGRRRYLVPALFLDPAAGRSRIRSSRP